MRHVGDPSQFTPFGMWLRQYCRGGKNGGNGLAITNLDFIIDDYDNKRLMLVEEKQNNGSLGAAQEKTFRIIDKALRSACTDFGYTYCGFYLLRMPGTMPGPGMTLNGVPITVEQLTAHCDFKKIHCAPLFIATSAEPPV